MSQENPFEKFTGGNSPENERVYSAEEQAAISRFRENQSLLLDAIIKKDEIAKYSQFPNEFKDELIAKYPELNELDKEAKLLEYEKYAMWHIFAGSTPLPSSTKFDFEEGDSVQEYMQSLVDTHCSEEELDKSE
jgi:hypothetical protein